MGLKADIGNLSKDAFEYLKRSTDSYKLRLVERLSMLLGDMICGFVLFLLLFVTFLALMVVVLLLLVPHIGVPLSIVSVALLMLATAMVVYLLRERLFIDGLVRHFVKIFFGEEDNCDGK